MPLPSAQQDEAFRAAAHRRDLEAAGGVAWSGLGSQPFRPLALEALQAEERRRRERLAAWRTSAAGRALAALAEVERQAAAIRAALARDPDQALPGPAAALAAAAETVCRTLAR